jgi:hypothetical protein
MLLLLLLLSVLLVWLVLLVWSLLVLLLRLLLLLLWLALRLLAAAPQQLLSAGFWQRCSCSSSRIGRGLRGTFASTLVCPWTG